jgi:hypothetical protein
MKNITVAVDDDTYRKARIAAARQDSSVSAMVKRFLQDLCAEEEAVRDLRQQQEALLDAIWQRHPSFTTADNLPRDAVHERPES